MRIVRWHLATHGSFLSFSFFCLYLTVLIECKPRSYFAKLAAAMRSAKYDPATKTITLPDGVRWPDLKSSILYARFFYNALWESVLKKGIPDSTCDGAVILGSPGSEFGNG